MFHGTHENVIRCINVECESRREEKFTSIQLDVMGNLTIEDSIRTYMAAERLDGDNQYMTDEHGKQDALKFIRLKKLPPVL